MVLDNIEQLIAKYENGETTLQEEALLKDYFSQETVAPHLEMYKPLFVYFLATQQEQFTKDVPLNSRKTNRIYKWISVAAVAVLTLGIYSAYFTGPTDAERNEALLALNQTMEALNMVSAKFNKGAEHMQLDLMSTNFNRGSQSIRYVDAFSQTTNKIFKTKQ